MGATEQKEAVRLIKSREKKNSYTQARPGYFWGYPKEGDPGKSDCSDTVRAVIKRALGKDIGGNTSAQIDNRKKLGVVVHETSGVYPDESKLVPGVTSLYFKGNTSHSLDVGHTELYIGNGKCMGHGSGIGPMVKDLKDYCKKRGTAEKRYFMAVNWNTESEKVYKLGERALSVDMVAPDVGQLQELLVYYLQYNLGTYGPKKDGVDYDYGSKTADAVKAEQKRAGLVQTGNADLVTIAAIVARASGKPVPTTQQHILVTGGTVNVRRGPSTHYKIVDVVVSGQVYEATGNVQDGWYELIYKGDRVWISGKMAEIVA